MNGDPEEAGTSLAAQPEPDRRAEIAIAMIRDEAQGLRLAARSGMTETEARLCRDRLLHAAPAVVNGTIEAQARRIDEQTAELARLALIAEEYRTGRQPGTAFRAGSLMPAGGADILERALPAARSWALRHLPVPLRFPPPARMAPDSAQTKTAFGRATRKLARILRREGVGGVVNRLRHTPIKLGRTPRARVSLASGALLADHGSDPSLATLLREIIPPPQGPGPHPTVHLGRPPGPVGPADVVVLPEPSAPARGLKRAALVADHCPDRLAQLRKAGCNVVAIGPPPFDASSFRRFLVLTRVIAPAQMDYAAAVAPALGRAVPRLCVTLPEFPERTQAFQAANRWDMHLVEGMRFHPPWVGAAHTYSRLARALLETKQQRALIAQDDLLPSPDFDSRLEIAEEYWLQSGADVLAGLVTDYDESFVLRRVVQYRGMTFLHLNKSVGLVCSMFGPRALQHMARWHRTISPGGEPYTIDRHMAAADLDVVTTLPFLVRHRSGVPSTIWPFGNGRYDTLIDFSERKLAQLAGERP